MASSSCLDLVGRGGRGVDVGQCDPGQQPRVLERLEAALHDRDQVQGHLAVVHRDAVPQAAALEHAHDRRVRPFGRRDDEVLGGLGLQHARERLVHDRPHAADEDGRDRGEVGGHLVFHQLLDVDRGEDLVGEVGRQGVRDLRLEQRLLHGLRDGARVEQHLVGPDREHARQHAEHAEDPEDQREHRPTDATPRRARLLVHGAAP